MTEDLKYRPRIADDILSDKLGAKGAVLIRGPNGVARQLLQSNKRKALFI